MSMTPEEQIEVIRHRAAGGRVEAITSCGTLDMIPKEHSFNFYEYKYRPIYTPEHPRMPRQGEMIEVRDQETPFWIKEVFVCFFEGKCLCKSIPSQRTASWEQWRLIEEPKTEPVAQNKDVRIALENLIEIIEKAGLHNLSTGVQLGSTSWFVKANDCMAYAKKVIEGCMETKSTPPPLQEPKPEPKLTKVPLTKKDFDGHPVIWVEEGGLEEMVQGITEEYVVLSECRKTWEDLLIMDYKYSTDRREWKPCYKLVHTTQENR